MRASLSALGLLCVATTSGCADTQSPCGGDGTFVADDDSGAAYCVYSASSPIVIEGGFQCPNTLPFENNLNAHRICSDSAFDDSVPPAVLCLEMPEVCRAMSSPPRSSASPPAPTSAPVEDDEELRAPLAWSSCAMPTLLDEALTGDACTEDIAGCGRSGDCSNAFAICDPDGTLKVSDLDVLDCEGRIGIGELTNPGVPHTALSCEDALESGKTFDVCTGEFACARRAAEACCVEYAVCSNAGVFYRYHFCERGCQNVASNEAVPPATACSDFRVSEPSDQLEIADRPCAGDFICWDGDDLTSGQGVTIGDVASGWLRWCEGGVVRGQRSASPLFGQAPMPGAPATP